MEKLNFLDVGPKISRIAIPFLVIAIALTIIFPGTFTLGESVQQLLLFCGIVVLLIGLIFYFITVSLLLKGLRNNRMVTNDPFALCQNPLYAALILMVFPGIALLMNSWIILIASVIAYIVFKGCIKDEYQVLEKFFGETYNHYRVKTPEFFPFPFRKWFDAKGNK